MRPNKRYCSAKCGKRSHLKTCVECNLEFFGEAAQKACSLKCGRAASMKANPHWQGRQKHVAREDIDMYRRWARRKHRLTKGINATRRRKRRQLLISVRLCRECGEEYNPQMEHQVYCSSLCNKRNTRRRDKLKRSPRLRSVKNEAVDPIAVFDRDGWTCQCCGTDTPRDLRGTYELNAPELDHIYPLSKGGAHTYNNTQCLCRGCNNTKSDFLPHEVKGRGRVKNIAFL